jgi:hypothetical protein
MGAVLMCLALMLLLAFAIRGQRRRRALRYWRRERMLAESWAIHQASREIHERTRETLQAMLDEIAKYTRK